MTCVMTDTMIANPSIYLTVPALLSPDFEECIMKCLELMKEPCSLQDCYKCSMLGPRSHDTCYPISFAV